MTRKCLSGDDAHRRKTDTGTDKSLLIHDALRWNPSKPPVKRADRGICLYFERQVIRGRSPS
jgi:hypothetical protein